MKVTTEFKRSSNNITAIILHYNCSDGKLKYYTGESSIPGKLTKKAEMMISFIEGVAADHRLASIPLTREILKEKLDLKFRPAQASGLIQKMETVIDKMKKGEIKTPDHLFYAKSTIKSLTLTVTKLSEFNKDLKTVTIKTYYSFIEWCQKNNYSLNYIGTLIKNWKTIGKLATKDSVYDDPDFKKLSEDTYDIYLNDSEITAIYNLPLSGRNDIVRDWFVLDYCTGLRVSDLVLLSERNIQKKFITIANKKTGEKVVIPLHRFGREILKKWNGFPPKTRDQEINELIKPIARKAKINDTVLYSITKGGKREDHYFKKWQMVSNHTCRRSFITNLLLSKIPESIVMKLSGLKSHATLQRYNKMTSEDAAKIMSKHKFFK